jgi:hypothetical protein
LETKKKEPIMANDAVTAVDIAKNVFEVLPTTRK